MSKSFLPPQRILHGPGPSNIHPRVLEAMARPTVGHLDPLFVELMDEIKSLLKYVFKTENDVTFPISAPGSVGMEACIVNVVEPGDKVAVCINGVFGGRMKDIIERCGGIAVPVEFDWGTVVDTNKVEEVLSTDNEIKVLAFVHAETSTGAMSDAKTLAQIAQSHDCYTIVDTVTALGGIPLLVDEWGLDAVYSGSQKCLSCPPGLSPVTFNQKAIDKIQNRKTKVQSWFSDLNLVLSYWGSGSKRAYHHTAPINALYALHESLLIIQEEGIESSWDRHKKNGDYFCSKVKELGLEPFGKDEERLPQLVPIKVPEGIEEAKVRSILLNEFNTEIGAGLGALAGKVWRVGLMGYSSSRESIDKLIEALKYALNKSKE